MRAANERNVVPYLLWAVGEARRLRIAGEGTDVLSGQPDGAESTTPASDRKDRSHPHVQSTPDPLRLSVERHGGRADVTVVGYLNVFTARQFSREVREQVERGARSVIVDLGGAEVVDSLGLMALVAELVELRRRDGEMVLKSPRAETLRMLDGAGLSDAFPIC